MCEPNPFPKILINILNKKHGSEIFTDPKCSKVKKAWNHSQNQNVRAPDSSV